jgi:hypothetical protein
MIAHGPKRTLRERGREFALACKAGIRVVGVDGLAMAKPARYVPDCSA